MLGKRRLVKAVMVAWHGTLSIDSVLGLGVCLMF